MSLYFIRYTTIHEHPTTSVDPKIYLDTLEDDSTIMEIFEYELQYGMHYLKSKLKRYINSSLNEGEKGKSVVKVLALSKL
jgi:hypothetical protein